MVPRDFAGSQSEYLEYVLNELLPVVKQENLARRVDIFIERSAFDAENALFT
jgi:imidazolonepropionase